MKMHQAELSKILGKIRIFGMKMPEHGRKMTPRWPQDGPKMSPTWPQDGANRVPRSFKMVFHGPKMAQDGHGWRRVSCKGVVAGSIALWLLSFGTFYHLDV